jgi:hypothetical protein
MIRSAVLVLLLANAAYFAWSQGHLLSLGGAGSWADPHPLREPQRLQQQLQPERLTVLPSAPNPAASASGTGNDGIAALAQGPAKCLQASGMTDSQASSLRDALGRALPAENWHLETTVQPARWVVYLGKFTSADSLRARKAELRAARVDHRDVNNPALQPGLVLGTFATEAAASQALRDTQRNGFKTAKVVAERPETRLHTLTLPQATPALQDSMRDITSGLADSPALDWQACPG